MTIFGTFDRLLHAELGLGSGKRHGKKGSKMGGSMLNWAWGAGKDTGKKGGFMLNWAWGAGKDTGKKGSKRVVF
jgi:hypothetical protein